MWFTKSKRQGQESDKIDERKQRIFLQVHFKSCHLVKDLLTFELLNSY